MNNRRRRLLPPTSHQCEILEDRALLTNFEVFDAFLADGQGNQMDDAILGERMGVRVRFRTDAIATAEYRIEFKVDGVIRDTMTTHGTGGAGTWSWTRTGWYATTGTHEIEITVDADNQIAEDDETDNSISFNVSTIRGTSPVRLSWPVEGEIQRDNYIFNFVDVDPTGELSDFQGGPYAYNGHAAWDIGPGHFSNMDDGIDVYAAAAGTVTAVSDGKFDRETDGFNITPAPISNYVIVDHGDGFETTYWHLRRDSVEVEVGQVVANGERLGLMGSSGISTGTHLHFGFRRHGRHIEAMMDPDTYLAVNVPYSDDVTIVRSSGVGTSDPIPHFKERAQRTNVFNSNSPVPHIWAFFTALNQGDLIEYVWRRPDSSVFTTTNVTATGDFRTGRWWASRNLGANAMLGMWTVDFLVNGTKLGEDQFEVTTNGAPELTVQQNQALVRHNRYTPINYGSSPLDGTEPEITFSVSNTGSALISITDVQVPEGFAIVQDLPSSLAVNASANLTIKRLTSAAGYAGGEVVIESNDYDEPVYRFSVEGLVETSDETLVLGIGLRSVDEANRTIANVRRPSPAATDLTVSLSAANHPGQLNFPQTVVIPAGSDFVNFWVTALDNSVVESDEFVQLLATAPSFSPAINNVEVVDNDVGFLLTASDGTTTVTESGDSDTVEVVLTHQPTSNVTIAVTSDNVSEVAVATPTLLFTPANWNVIQSITLTGVDDSEIDGDQVVEAIVSVASSSDQRFATLAEQRVTLTNIDNDIPGFVVSELSGTAAVEGGATDDFGVALSAAPSSDVVFTIASADSSEILVEPSTLTFTAENWSVVQDVLVTAVDDSILDGDQETTITIAVDSTASDSDFATLSDQFVVATSIDDEIAAFTIVETDGTSVSEDASTDTVSVVLDASPESDVVFDLLTSRDSEVELDRSSLRFTSANWNTPQTITFTGIDDSATDGNQQTIVTISVNDSASNVVFADVADQAISVTTVDNDMTTFTISDVATSEDDQFVTFAVAASNPVDTDVTIDISLSSASGVQSDLAAAVTSVTFPGGTAGMQTVMIAVTDDDLVEATESFTASLSVSETTPIGIRSIDTSDEAVGTITDNDSGVLTIEDFSLSEDGEANSFTLNISNPLDMDLQLNLNYQPDSATAADYANSTTAITILAGTTQQEISIPATDDNLVEITETFGVELAVTSPASLGERSVDASDTATATVIDNDSAIFTIDNIAISESAGVATFHVEVANPIDVDLTFEVDIQNGSTANTDLGSATQSITFPAGTTTAQEVTVAIANDDIVELAETFGVSLNISDSTVFGDRNVDWNDAAVGTITDNDTATFTVGDVTVNERDGVANFQVTLSNPVDTDISVNVIYLLGSARTTDFDATSDMVTFVGGSTEPQAAVVEIINDGTEEPEEMFRATLSVSSATSIGSRSVNMTDTAIGTIIDDDGGSPGDVDGDSDFDANDSFLIHLLKLAGTNSQVNQSKGSSSQTATEIRTAVDNMNLAADVDGDSDFDANDSFLIHLVKLAGTDQQIDQSKGSSTLSATQIRDKIAALQGSSSASSRRFVNTNPVLAQNFSAPQKWPALFQEATIEAVVPEVAAETERPFVPAEVWEEFRSWIDLV